MTERTLTITAAEWASRKDGRLWLAREGNDWTSGGGHLLSMSTPPAEFVQACAPCETCDDTQDHPVLFDGERLHVPACPDCRIELVGPCEECDGDGYFDGWDTSTADEQRTPENIETVDCAACDAMGTVTPGHAYAVGQPLPIIAQPSADAWPTTECVVAIGQRIEHWEPTGWTSDAIVTSDITDRLAHYGPSESLVGKWAIQLDVTNV